MVERLPCAYFVRAQMAQIAKMAQIRSDLIDLALWGGGGGGGAQTPNKGSRSALKAIWSLIIHRIQIWSSNNQINWRKKTDKQTLQYHHKKQQQKHSDNFSQKPEKSSISVHLLEVWGKFRRGSNVRFRRPKLPLPSCLVPWLVPVHQSTYVLSTRPLPSLLPSPPDHPCLSPGPSRILASLTLSKFTLTCLPGYPYSLIQLMDSTQNLYLLDHWMDIAIQVAHTLYKLTNKRGVSCC